MTLAAVLLEDGNHLVDEIDFRSSSLWLNRDKRANDDDKAASEL